MVQLTLAASAISIGNRLLKDSGMRIGLAQVAGRVYEPYVSVHKPISARPGTAPYKSDTLPSTKFS